MIDLLITNGLVIDGSGSPGFFAAVLVENETVTVQRGDVSNLEAVRTIDATGRNRLKHQPFVSMLAVLIASSLGCIRSLLAPYVGRCGPRRFVP